jgi:hypothetical protein
LKKKVNKLNRSEESKTVQAKMEHPVLKVGKNSSKSVAAPDSGVKFTIQKKENKTGLPDNLKSGIEHLSGIDISDVKVNYNSPHPAQLNAHAFAQGDQIHLASGQEKHLPHEAWHVVQQKQGRVKPTYQLKNKTNINDSPDLEQEADLMGKKALQLKQEFPVLENFVIHNGEKNGTNLAQLQAIKNTVIQMFNGTLPIQLTKAEELMPKIKKGEERLFAKYLFDLKLKAFENKNIAAIQTELFVDKKDFDDLTTWAEQWRAQAKGSAEKKDEELKAAFAPKKESKMVEAPLPPTFTSKNDKISFKTNIQSGIDGFFNLWYYHRLHVLDVDVKFTLPSSPKQGILTTLAAIRGFWSNSFHFFNVRTGENVRVDVNIIRTPVGSHYTYGDLDGSAANPQVLRASQRFNTKTIEEDTKNEKQPSALHEFGHTLGLGEEYDLKSDQEEGKDLVHHFSMATETNRGKITVGKDKSVPDSIMGKGPKVQPQHFSAVLNEFCKLIDGDKREWQIKPGRG